MLCTVFDSRPRAELKAYGRVVVLIHAFLNSVVGVGECSPTCMRCFTQRQRVLDTHSVGGRALETLEQRKINCPCLELHSYLSSCCVSTPVGISHSRQSKFSLKPCHECVIDRNNDSYPLRHITTVPWNSLVTHPLVASVHQLGYPTPDNQSFLETLSWMRNWPE
jgi:hypothetical protein